MHGLEDETTKQRNLLRDKGDFDGAIAAYTEPYVGIHETLSRTPAGAKLTGEKANGTRPSPTVTRPLQLDPMAAEAYYTRGYSHGRKR